MKKIFCLFFLLAFISIDAIPENYKSLKDCEAVIQNFFILLKKGKETEAMDLLFKDNPWIKADSEVIINTKKILKNYKDQMGELESYEKVLTKDFKNRLFVYNYLGCYERQPLLFIFVFYKPNTDWFVFNFKIDNEFTDDLKEFKIEDLLKKE